jgi:hypothetical protein
MMVVSLTADASEEASSEDEETFQMVDVEDEETFQTVAVVDVVLDEMLLE